MPLHRACRAWAGGSASRLAGGLPASPAPRENRNWTDQDKVGARASIDAGESAADAVHACCKPRTSRPICLCRLCPADSGLLLKPDRFHCKMKGPEFRRCCLPGEAGDTALGRGSRHACRSARRSRRLSVLRSKRFPFLTTGVPTWFSGTTLRMEFDRDLRRRFLKCLVHLLRGVGQAIRVDVDAYAAAGTLHVFTRLQSPNALLKVVTAARALKLDHVKIDVRHRASTVGKGAARGICGTFQRSEMVKMPLMEDRIRVGRCYGMTIGGQGYPNLSVGYWR
jgi:hypothetical protein